MKRSRPSTPEQLLHQEHKIITPPFDMSASSPPSPRIWPKTLSTAAQHIRSRISSGGYGKLARPTFIRRESSKDSATATPGAVITAVDEGWTIIDCRRRSRKSSVIVTRQLEGHLRSRTQSETHTSPSSSPGRTHVSEVLLRYSEILSTSTPPSSGLNPNHPQPRPHHHHHHHHRSRKTPSPVPTEIIDDPSSHPLTQADHVRACQALGIKTRDWAYSDGRPVLR